MQLLERKIDTYLIEWRSGRLVERSRGDSLIPVEVKAKDGATASLNNLIKWDSYPDVHYGIKLGYKNIGWNGAFYTFPYFLTFLIKRFLNDKKS